MEYTKKQQQILRDFEIAIFKAREKENYTEAGKLNLKSIAIQKSWENK